MSQFSRSELLIYTNGLITYVSMQTHTQATHNTRLRGHYYSGFSEGQFGLKASGGQLCLLQVDTTTHFCLSLALSLPPFLPLSHYFELI